MVDFSAITNSPMRRIRKEKNIKQQPLSVQSGVSTATIVKIELYGYIPTKKTRVALAATLGVTEEMLWPNIIVHTLAKSSIDDINVHECTSPDVA